MRLRVGFLGMADNLSAQIIVTELARLGRPVDVVFLQHAGVRTQWRRMARKLKASGPAATLQRVALALKCRLRATAASVGADTTCWSVTVHHVGEVNAEETRRRIRAEQLDLLLIVTDSMLGRGTFSIPRLGTLNAHPGWLPRYRGLGATMCMLRDGVAPAISVHIVDEGIDTGPVLVREPVDPDIAFEGIAADLACYREQARMFAKAIELFEIGQPIPIDTFLEPSGMARAPSAAEARKIYAALRRGGPRKLVSPNDAQGALVPSGDGNQVGRPAAPAQLNNQSLA